MGFELVLVRNHRTRRGVGEHVILRPERVRDVLNDSRFNSDGIQRELRLGPDGSIATGAWIPQNTYSDGSKRPDTIIVSASDDSIDLFEVLLDYRGNASWNSVLDFIANYRGGSSLIIATGDPGQRVRGFSVLEGRDAVSSQDLSGNVLDGNYHEVFIGELAYFRAQTRGIGQRRGWTWAQQNQYALANRIRNAIHEIAHSRQGGHIWGGYDNYVSTANLSQDPNVVAANDPTETLTEEVTRAIVTARYRRSISTAMLEAALSDQRGSAASVARFHQSVGLAAFIRMRSGTVTGKLAGPEQQNFQAILNQPGTHLRLRAGADPTLAASYYIDAGNADLNTRIETSANELYGGGPGSGISIGAELGGEEITTDQAISRGEIEHEAVLRLTAIEQVRTIELAGQAGRILGSALAQAIHTGNMFGDIAVDGVLSTVFENFYELVVAGGLSKTLADGDIYRVFDDLPSELLANLRQAGIGALSSYLTAQLADALGLHGVVGGAAQSVGGAFITAVLDNIVANPLANPFRDINPVNTISSAIGSYIGSRLASEVYTPTNVGGQIGAAYGRGIGALGGGMLAAGANPIVATAIIAAAVFVSQLLYSFIGSLFGGTPRSGADVEWNAAKSEFGVTNVYSRKGGKKDAAKSIAEGVAGLFNSVLDHSGATLLDPQGVQTGNYGMRSKTFVYRPTSTRDKDAITARFKDGNELIRHGVYLGLDSMATRLAGGDVYVKRALLATLAQSNGTPNSDAAGAAGEFDIDILVGNLKVGSDYSRYLGQKISVNSMLVLSPESTFAATWLLTLTRAVELGLHRRAASDWTGGFVTWLDQMGDGKIDGNSIVATELFPTFDAVTRMRSMRLLDEENELIGYAEDTIDVNAMTYVAGTASADVIRLSGSQLLAQDGTTNANLKLNGEGHNGSAVQVDVAANVEGGEGNDEIHTSDRGDNALGQGGNDHIYGGRLDDWLFGGDGNDELHAGAQAGGLAGDGNYLDGGEGDDTLHGGEGSDWLEGGEGADTLDGGGGDDILAGGGGALDQLKGGHGDDQYLVRLGDGADQADEVASGAPVSTGTGNVVRDRFVMLLNPQFAHLRNWFGGAAEIETAETLRETAPVGTPGTVAAVAAGGEDAIVFGHGISMGDVKLVRSQAPGDPPGVTTGSDLEVHVMLDADGNTLVDATTKLIVRDWFSNPFKRIEWLKFADGNEIRIGDIETFIVGTQNDDILNGTEGNDFVYGGGGNDHIHLYGGNDVGSGGTGDDAVWGDGDRDVLIGGLGRDKLFGGTHDDVLSGDAGDDELMGEDGTDVLSGGRGDDLITGGQGADTIKFSRGDGRDTIIAEPGIAVDPQDEAGWQTIYMAGDGDVYYEDISYFGHYRWYDAPDGRALQQYHGTNFTTVFSASDTIEFDIDIDIQDIVLQRNGLDLTLIVADDNSELSHAASAADTITIKSWYQSADAAQWGTTRPIGRFAFYQTGILEAATESWTLIAGTAGADGSVTAAFSGTGGKDWITGGGGDDVIDGLGGDDILNGNAGFDEIRGSGGADVLYGGAGDDVLVGGSGADVLVGGEGSDTASYAGSGAVRADLGDPTRNTGDAVGDNYFDIENLTGSANADWLGGDGGQNILEGGKGADTVRGGGGDDLYVWNVGDGADTIADGIYEFEQFMAPDGTFPASYEVTAHWETLTGSVRRYELEIIGPAGTVYRKFFNSAVVYTEARPDLWPADGWKLGFARTGNGKQVARETLLANDAGEDTLELGVGISLSDLTFEVSNMDLIIRHGGSATEGVTIRGQFAPGTAARVEWLHLADGQAISLRDVLAATASAPNVADDGDEIADELLAGDGSANSLSGGGGNDGLSGAGGNDYLSGGEGNDILEGGAGGDTIDGGAHGPARTDPNAPAGTPPADPVGWGDTARYAGSAASVRIALAGAAAAYAAGGDADGDVITNVEHIVGSNATGATPWGNAGDHLTGDGADNRLFGLAGDDYLAGGDGNDVLIGGEGTDALHGGAGDDNIDGGDGNDFLYGGTGIDFLVGGAGDDRLEAGAPASADPGAGSGLDGGEGDDHLYAAAGDDELIGAQGNDYLSGGLGADLLDGGEGSDELYGGDGNDALAGGDGDDLQLQGGAGDDLYVFGANTGVDRITDASGENHILFHQVEPEQLWLTRSGNDLRIRVIGGNSDITVLGYFSGPVSAIKDISAGASSIFPKYASSLISLMSAAPVPQTVADIPAAIAAARDPLWIEGGQPAPSVADQTYAISERAEPAASVTLPGQVGAVDYDENIAGAASYSILTGPHLGTVTLSATTAGAWAYVPTLYANGTDTFRVKVVDADGNAAEQTVTVNIAPVNSKPVFAASQPSLSIPETATGGTEVATIAVSDPEGTPLNLSIAEANSPFQISATGVLSVKTGATFSSQSTPTINVTVHASDNVTPTVSQLLSVTIINVNDPPGTPTVNGTAVAFAPEGALGGTTIANFNLPDPDGDATSLRIRTGSTSIFATSGSTLRFAAGFTPNFETVAAGATLVDRDLDGQKEVEYSVAVESWDGQVASTAATTMVVGIEDVNEAPTSITLTGAATAAERDRPQSGAPSPALSLGTLSAADPDVYFAETFVFTPNDSRFEVVNGNELRLKAGAALDYESALVDGSNRRYLDLSVTARDHGGTGLPLTQNVRIFISDSIDYIYGTAAAETLSGTLGRDAIYGRDGNDVLQGLQGDDELYGEAGVDALYGGDGNDILDAGLGADTLEGGLGDDVHIVDDGGDSVVEQSGQGSDEVRTSLASYTLTANVEKLTGTLATGQTLRGNVHDNILAGGAGGDTFLLQDTGLDKVIGGGGNDTVYFGGTHSAGDEFDGGIGTDTALFQGNTNISAADMRLFNIESISLLAGSNNAWGDNFNNRYSYSFTATEATAAAGVQLKVNGSSLLAGENLTFNGAADTDSSFYILGGMGVDTLTGGAGNDIFYFDKDGRWAAGDTVVGGAGSADEIILRGAYSMAFGAGSFTGVEKLTILNGTGWSTQFSYNLSTNQSNVAYGQMLTVNASNLLAGETLTFSGAAETDGFLHITGGAGADVLTGGALADAILGGAGNDTLTGGTGSDRLEGGSGDDIYFVDNSSDQAVELANEGVDEVRTSAADTTLGVNVEKLTGTLATGQTLRANAGDNIVTAGAGTGTNWFWLQSGGIDTATGASGGDIFLMGANFGAGDTISGGAGSDQVVLQGNYNYVVGAAQWNSIESLAILNGLTTTYWDSGLNFYSYNLTLNNANIAAGVQLVVDANTLRVGENLTFSIAGELDGSALIYGGLGVDTLTGGAGADTFYFSSGKFGASDVLVGGAGLDSLYLRHGLTATIGAGQLTGIETIGFAAGTAGVTANYNITANNANLAAGGLMTVAGSALLATESLTFNAAAETDGNYNMTGGAGADVLTGGALADTIVGGAGNDTLSGGAGADRLEGGTGDDIFIVDSAADTVVEIAGQGAADEVQTALADYTLAAEVEKLTGTSATGQTLRGNTLNNIVKGGIGNDTLILDAGGNDTADGGAGDDVIALGATFGASDTIVGGAGMDSITLEGNYNVTLAATTLSGLEGVSLRSNPNAASFYSYVFTLNNANVAAGEYLLFNSSLLRAGETVNVNAAAEIDGQLIIVGGASTETATGGAYNDVFYFTQGMLGASDVMVGGAGWDSLYFAGGVTATLAATTISGVEAIAFVAGTAGTSYNITAHNGNAAAGATLSIYGDAMTAGEFLTFNGSAETDGYFWMTGGASNDTVIGGALADTMKSAAGDDTLSGRGGNDRLEGGDGNDVLEGGAGADQLVGGNGTDRATYAGSAAITATLTESVGAISEGGYTKAAVSLSYTGVRVDLVANSSADPVNFAGATAAIGGDAEGDRFSGIENVTGSGFNDRLRGTAAATEVRGGAGNDLIYGGDGDDTLYGDGDDDYIYGQEGRDTLYGGAGNDRLFGEGLGDTLYGGTGDDDLIGGAGQDIYRFEASFGNDTVYNYDGDGSPDVMEFDSTAMANTDLWFSKSGKDLVIKQLGTTNQATVKGYFLNTTPGDWDDNGDFVVNAIIAGAWASNYKVNTPALLTLMNQIGQPTSFGALTLQQQDQIKSAWGVNSKPTITAFASNPVSTGEGYFVDLKFTVADGQSPASSLKLTSTLTSGVFQPILASDWSFDPTDDKVRILRLRPVVDAHGLATLTLSANDWVFDSDLFTTSVRLLARADPVFVTAALTKSTNVGTTVLLPGTLAGGALAQISDWNSEIFNHVKIEGVPVGATLSDGAGNTFTATAGNTIATITGWNLAALRVTPAAGSTTDFTMTLKAASKENLQPFEIFPGEQIGPESSTTIKVIVNAAPTSVGLLGLGMAATPSVNEFTPTTNPAGALIGVAVASDPDSIEANRISTDFNLLPKAGSGEERIVNATGPTGTQVQVLETGQLAGLGGDGANAGGGVYGASAGAPDTTRAYKYTIYVKPENMLGHYLYLGAIGQVENATTGAADGNPYFFYGLSNSLTQDRWYRIEGWVLPAGHAPVAGDVFGGVFDTVSGAKVANTTTFRFAPGATDTGVRFFSYYGQSATGYSAQWYQPQVEKLDFDYSLIDNAGGRFAINSVTGLVTAVGTNFNYEALTSHNVTVRATDSTGLIKDQVIAVGVNNINEKPGPLVLQSQTLYSEVVGSDTPHPGQSIVRFTMTDPDLTTPSLTIIGGNTYNWFATTGNQLTFGGANFTAGWLHGTLGQYGQDAGYYYDTDGDGLMEIRVATLTLAATDSGGLQSDPFTYNVLIEDKNEAPAFATQTLLTPENPGSYQLVGTAVGSDIDGPASDLRYLFNGATSYYDATLARTVSASSDGKFVVDFADGRVWTKGAQALNFEGPNAFSYTMQVFDRANGTHKLSATGTLNINLTNVNEAPGPMTLASQTLHSETLPGDTPHYSAGPIATFGLSDPDGTTPSISIIGGNGNGWFGISGNQLIFSTANFSASWLRSYAGQYGTDAAWSYDTDNDGLKEIRVATLTLAATDAGGLQGTPFTYNVYIEDKNEAPAFAANPYSFSVVENTAAYQYLGAVSASDVDGPAGELRYTFDGGQWYTDGTLGRTVTRSADNRFLMDFLDGRIWKAPTYGVDYEATPALSYQINVYDRALGNNMKWSNATLNVAVQNVNDNAPAMPTVDQWGTTAFNENSGSSMAIAYLSVPYDPDGSSGLSYQITSNPDNLFEISGWAIRMKADRTPNYETFASGGASTTIQVRFRVTDGTFGSPENAINVTIYNLADTGPWFTQTPTTFTVAENTAYGAVVSDGVRAAHSDSGSIAYSIDSASNPNGAFGVNAYGQITIANGVDYEAANWLADASGKYANLIVRASDGGGSVQTSVQVRITNQVLTVIAPNGAMNSRYRQDMESTNMNDPFGEPGYNGGWGNYGNWYTEIRYVDNVTGAVVMRDGAYGPQYNTTTRPLPDPNYWQLAEGFRRTGNGYELISDDEYNSWSLAPIVLDLLGAGLDNAFGTKDVAFDIDGNGAPEQLKWLNPGFAFLALDRNGDGRIGSGLEISFTQDKAGAQTDLEGLAAFDSNADGALTAADLRFGDFLVWQDVNADGTSQATELKTLTQAGIVSIGLVGTPTGRTLANTSGNVTLNTGSFTFADGSAGMLGDTILRASFGDAADAEGVGFEARDFARKAGKYRLSADGGILSIVPLKPRGTLDPRAGTIGAASMLSFRNRRIGMLAPVVLDLDGDGIELVKSNKARARFDMDGDGVADDTGWVGKGDGLLVIDRNGDGRISGPGELSFLAEKKGAKSDLDALSALDSNRDGKLDATDARFGELKVWEDRNGNGVTEEGELRSLADRGIASIGLAAATARQTAKLGDNIVLSTGTFTRADGSTGTLADAALAFRPGRGGSGQGVADALEMRLEALRAGLDSSFRLDAFDFETLAGPESMAAGPLEIAPGPVELLDRRTALMAQHMAAFGAHDGEAEWRLREQPQAARFDYFA